MSKKNYYLTLDTETATLPFIDKVATNDKERKKISIAKPLVYDIGWTVCDRQGTIIKEKNYLVQETFFVPSVFNTAYYKDKRPLYIEKLKRNEIQVALWNDIVDDLIHDLKKVVIATAFNACFDYKKAIPFTEKYIQALYSDNYNEFENRQIKSCKKIIQGKNNAKNKEFLEPYLKLRNEKFDITDLWSLTCERLINTTKYKKFCLNNGLLTNSGLYFSTNAESVFQYLNQDIDFTEEHTALSDSEIETVILSKCLKKGKAIPNINCFPFQILGTTTEFAKKQKDKKYSEIVLKALIDYYKSIENINYASKIMDSITELKEIVKND